MFPKYKYQLQNTYNIINLIQYNREKEFTEHIILACRKKMPIMPHFHRLFQCIYITITHILLLQLVCMACHKIMLYRIRTLRIESRGRCSRCGTNRTGLITFNYHRSQIKKQPIWSSTIQQDSQVTAYCGTK